MARDCKTPSRTGLICLCLNVQILRQMQLNFSPEEFFLVTPPMSLCRIKRLRKRLPVTHQHDMYSKGVYRVVLTEGCAPAELCHPYLEQSSDKVQLHTPVPGLAREQRLTTEANQTMTMSYLQLC